MSELTDKQLMKEAELYLKEYYLTMKLIGREPVGGLEKLNELIVELQNRTA